MKKINVASINEENWKSPRGKFESYDKEISVALGRENDSLDLRKRHPFDVSILRIPPGKASCPYHSHSAQWEFYHVISGRGKVRHDEGAASIETGDAFLFEPGQAHQLINDSESDLVIYVVADNPVGESCFYPDSNKWLVRSPNRALIRSESLDYLDGEE